MIRFPISFANEFIHPDISVIQSSSWVFVISFTTSPAIGRHFVHILVCGPSNPCGRSSVPNLETVILLIKSRPSPLPSKRRLSYRIPRAMTYTPTCTGYNSLRLPDRPIGVMCLPIEQGTTIQSVVVASVSCQLSGSIIIYLNCLPWGLVI